MCGLGIVIRMWQVCSGLSRKSCMAWAEVNIRMQLSHRSGMQNTSDDVGLPRQPARLAPRWGEHPNARCYVGVSPDGITMHEVRH